jgi:transcriptional regulator with XRE-family HTH domain
MDDFNSGVKERFVLFCLKNKIKTNELATAVGVSRETVRLWFDFDLNRRLPSLTAIHYLSDGYGLSADWLFGIEKKGE